MNFRFTFWLIGLVLLSFNALAQEGKIKGFVYEKETNLPVPYANIVLKGTTIGTTANQDGYFVVNNVPPGKYTVEISFLGLANYTQEVVVKADKLVSIKAYMKPASEVLDDIEVYGDRTARETKVLTSVISLQPKQIQQFSVGGDADIVKALQVLPGVITSGDQGGQIFIRGGAPVQNLILMDGMIIYNPFHSIGFFSVFDVDIVKSTDLYTGGFKAEYGSRNSAVLDIKTRDGNREKFSAKLTTSTFTSKLLLETPIGRKRDDGKTISSFLVSAKTSYLDQTDEIFYPYVETQYGGLPFSFNDLYAKFSSQVDNGSRFGIFGFAFDDAVSFGAGNSVNWDSYGAGMNFQAIPSSSTVLLSGDFAYSVYDITAIENGTLPRNSRISSFNFGLDFTYFQRKNDELKFGIEGIGYGTDFSLPNQLGFIVNQEEFTTEIGGYLQYKYAYKTRFLFEPGLRVHYYGSLGEVSIEPRFGVKYNINEFLRVKAAGGLYSQNLVAANSDRDVVNLFYGFLSGPSDLPDSFRGEPVTSSLQLARHLIAGFEVEVSRRLTLNVEGFIKDFNQLTNVNRNKIYDDNTENQNQPDVLKKDYIVERGLAQGVDFLAKYQTKKLYVWLAYSLSRITRDDAITEYAPYFDRRHNLNLVTNYTFGKDRSWEASFRYNFGSGFPFTPTQLFYSQKPFTTSNGQPNIAYDYTRENGEFDVLYGDLNSSRLPNYHRVDVSITKTYKLTKHQELGISLGATNVFNYQNIFFYDRINNARVDQLPFIPSLSLSYSF